MSTNTFPVFFNSQLLGDTVNTLYTVPSSPSGITLQDLQVKLTNTTTATRSVSVYAVQSAGSPTPDNAVVYEMTIPPNDYVMVPVERLPNSASIQAAADIASAVSIQPIGGKLHTP